MSGFEVNEVVLALQRTRIEWRDSQGRAREPAGREFPSRNALAGVVECLKGVLFPLRLGPSDLRHESEDFYVARTLDSALHTLLDQALLELRYTARRTLAPAADSDQSARALLRDFAAGLPAIRRLLDSDAVAAYEGDPAAHSVDEVLLCYPGLLAMIHHRLAHRLYTLGLPLLARIISELAHGQTGIDIHPGATIGPRFFIDHGTGVVIGETAVIGQGVRLYQNVTLGAKRFPTEADGTTLKKGLPRHPIVEDDVVVYAGATILGRVTIGRGAVIGGNVWLTDSVPAGASVTQATLQNAPHAAGPTGPRD
ncbi:serine O-acetyltransferase EpsC [Xylophilus sp. Leaf220]|uniref:serine O-acetyltransferase EpsC n=1 Tax=Xylophilus sp. Leaf220 TaxID=1735686 RepID=UPI0007005F45|nr:serine O-acetyltransferase EpsC [Xylophilus sp. Leaf220]KQM75415.1 serine acetyltransferase [Xylophilus sp. Leaf220]